MASHENAPRRLVVADWSTLVSVDQHIDFDASRLFPPCNASFQLNQRHNSSSVAAGGSAIGNDRFPQMMEPSAYPEFETPLAMGTWDLEQNIKQAVERDSKGMKRKDSPASNIHETDAPTSSDNNMSIEQDKKQQQQQQQKNQSNTTRKPGGRSTKGRSQEGSGGADEEDYIHHVRAKRGQATNSHSLAERIRRERISERMRLLQDLVPGCNKITGKAVMLDEIINYVQSLQRQVEFLSMKLATVNQEFNSHLGRILKRDTRGGGGGGGGGGGSLAGDFARGMSSFNPPSITALSFQGSSTGIETSLCGVSTSESDHTSRASYLHAPGVARATSLWSDELRNVAHPGCIADVPAGGGTDRNGSAKMQPPHHPMGN